MLAFDRITEACISGDAPAVARLLDVSPELLTPALWPPAIFRGKSLEVTRLLLDRGLNPDECSAPRKPLHLAADRGLVDIVRLLLDRGARLDVVDEENITPYELMCCFLRSAPKAEELRQIFRDAGATDSIFTHIYLGHDAEAIAMLRADPSLANAHGPVWFTPLQTAARAARPEVIQALLDAGAPVDDPRPNACMALWLACQSNADPARRLIVAKMLLEAGAGPRRACDDEQTTALHFAASRGPVAMVELLLRHGAKEWQPSGAGKTALDYAREGQALDKPFLIELLDRPVMRNPIFKRAVAAVQTGDLPKLRQLLAEHPNLVRDRAMEPECYPPSYFSNPKLLWFVADNPNVIETMPANSVAIAGAIIDAGAEPADLNYALGLVMTSRPAREQNLQRPLMKLLLDRGATVNPKDLLGTLGHGERDAVAALLEIGLPINAPIAAGLGRVDDLARLLPSADESTKHAALSMAVINRELESARLCLAAGADVNAFMAAHSHSTPIHQATANDDIPMLQLLVEHGAKLDIRDRLWNGTPLGWAIHMKNSAAEAFLRSIGAA